MYPRILLLGCLAALTLVGCGGGPVKRISPPTASVQELTVQPDGSWRVQLRVQNFSNVSMTFSAIDATLDINGARIGTVSLPLDLDIPGGSVDVVSATLRPDLKPAPDTTLDYRLEGSIRSSEPKGNYDFKRSSQLSPVPGLPGTWR